MFDRADQPLQLTRVSYITWRPPFDNLWLCGRDGLLTFEMRGLPETDSEHATWAGKLFSTSSSADCHFGFKQQSGE
jgi:hypothetical protein